MLSYNASKVFKCVKSICDNSQCPTCGKLIGQCVRFQCGHSMCEGCAEKAGECVFCVTSSSDLYVLDKPQTDRLNNTSTLLTTFHDTFKVNAYQQHKISDHLKLEKQVFPECIQAPCPYFNKRKSLNVSKRNKENIDTAIFLGEHITSSEIVKMKKSCQYVQNWLKEHEDVPQKLPRKPFEDININSQALRHKGKKNVSTFNTVNTEINSKKSICRKKSNIKSKKAPLIKGFMKSNLKYEDQIKQKKSIVVETSKECLMKQKSDREESGIVIDDSPIVLDDTQIDKDHLAWLSVLKRAEQEQSSDIEHSLDNINNDSSLNIIDHLNDADKIGLHITKPVLFFRKAGLFESCNLCNQYTDRKSNSHSNIEGSNDVSITINNSAFVTTIKLIHCAQNNSEILNKSTVAIQTDKPMEPTEHKFFSACENTIKLKRKNMLIDEFIPTKTTKSNVAIQSLDIFTTDKSTEHGSQSHCEKVTNKQNICDDSARQSKNVIIEDSDTDSNSSHDNIHEVIADVHRTSTPENVQHGILKALSETNYHHRSKQPMRGHTPNSSDSSDKENLDPNRNKQSKFGKKIKYKK